MSKATSHENGRPQRYTFWKKNLKSGETEKEEKYFYSELGFYQALALWNYQGQGHWQYWS
jgi:hypothetical protein